jgi:hypothetical protein
MTRELKEWGEWEVKEWDKIFLAKQTKKENIIKLKKRVKWRRIVNCKKLFFHRLLFTSRIMKDIILKAETFRNNTAGPGEWHAESWPQPLVSACEKRNPYLKTKTRYKRHKWLCVCYKIHFEVERGEVLGII